MKKYLAVVAMLVTVLLMTAAPALASTSPWVGAYVPGAPASITPLAELESQIGTSAAVSNFFISDTESFPAGRAQTVVDHGSIPMVTLEFWSTKTGGLSSITNGDKDVYLRNFADDAKQFGHTVYLRPFHEMNGNWYPWAGTAAGNSPAKLIAAWRHVRQVFAARGATNVKFVWCVNNDSVPDTSANSIAAYYPGDAYVDYTALDGYNFGTYASWSSWRTFAGVFGNAYARVTALSAKPLFIAETGCVEQGGNKAAWITNMFQAISTSYPKIAGVCWFNALKGEDWRIESSSASLAAFRTASTTSASAPVVAAAKTASSTGLRISTLRARYGTRVFVTGTVNPGASGQRVILQRRRSTGSWKNLTRSAVTLNSSSVYYFAYSTTPRGTWYFRTIYAGSPNVAASMSSSLKLVVR